MVAPDRYILATNGPYFLDARNNFTSMSLYELQNYINEIGLNYHIPPVLTWGQRQISTSDAKAARLIMSTRWIVVSWNGHLKSIFKMFQGTVLTIYARYLRIASALINQFLSLICLSGTVELAREMLEKSLRMNIV